MAQPLRVADSRPTFTREEVEEILRRATEHAKVATDDGIRHEELLEAAREVGLDPKAIEEAAAELEAQREQRRDEVEARAELTEERRRGFLSALTTYVVVGLFLAAINLTVASGPWAVWVLAIWGLFVGLRGSRLLFPVDPTRIEKRAAQKRKRREADARKAAARKEAEAWAERLRAEMQGSARRADQAARASRDFEDAVEKGVQALLGVLARNIREVAARAEETGRQRDSEFNRYVDRQKRTAGEPVGPPAKVRVELHPREKAREAEREEREGREAEREERERRRRR